MRIRTAAILLLIAGVVGLSARDFLRAREREPLYPSPDLREVYKLSDYGRSLRGSRGDTEVYVLQGAEPGGVVLVLGGTHPNEPAGYLAAVAILENARVERGTLIVIPRANNSAFTHTEPGEGHPGIFGIPTAQGVRRFRLGCRFTNPLDQWPDPEVYLHYPSGQRLSGGETRNLNRAFPGRADGDFTERVARAITELVKRECVDLVIDLHEASPEYPVINAIVAHERAADLAAIANLTLQSEGVAFSLEPSPLNFRGLSHRELGDSTQAYAILLESANIMQGRLRGRTIADKVLSGLDPCYLRASRAGLLRVPYDAKGISIETRVGRHLVAVQALMEALSAMRPDRIVMIEGLPGMGELERNGLGNYLAAKERQ